MRRKGKQEMGGSIEALRLEAQGLEKEIFALRNENSMNRKLEKPHLLRQKKRDRARILTRLGQLKRGVDAAGK